MRGAVKTGTLKIPWRYQGNALTGSNPNLLRVFPLLVRVERPQLCLPADCSWPP